MAMPDPEMKLRPLGPTDIGLMRDMLRMFGRAFDDLPTYTAAQPDDAYLARLLGSDTFIAVAALQGEVVVGGLAAYVLPKFERARSEVYLRPGSGGHAPPPRHRHRADRRTAPDRRRAGRLSRVRAGGLRR